MDRMELEVETAPVAARRLSSDAFLGILGKMWVKRVTAVLDCPHRRLIYSMPSHNVQRLLERNMVIVTDPVGPTCTYHTIVCRAPAAPL